MKNAGVYPTKRESSLSILKHIQKGTVLLAAFANGRFREVLGWLLWKLSWKNGITFGWVIIKSPCDQAKVVLLTDGFISQLFICACFSCVLDNKSLGKVVLLSGFWSY